MTTIRRLWNSARWFVLLKIRRAISVPCRDTVQRTEQAIPQRLPVKAKKKPRPHHTLCAGIVWHNDKVLITQRPQNGLLGGLWEFPAGTQRDGESLQDTCVRGIRETAGIDVEIRDSLTALSNTLLRTSVSPCTRSNVIMSKVERGHSVAIISHGLCVPISTLMLFPVPAADSLSIYNKMFSPTFFFEVQNQKYPQMDADGRR